MDAFETIIFEKASGVAYITLNRPRELNAYNMAMRDEFAQVLYAIKNDPDIGVIILRGSGKAFCAGADLKEFGTSPSISIARSVRWERDIWGSFLDVEKPMIAVIDGYCLGSGLEIALLCDFRIASQNAVFGMPEVRLGMIPAAGGTQTLPRLTTTSKALELLLTSRYIDSKEALEWGLINTISANGTLDKEATQLAHSLLEVNSLVMHAAKQALREANDITFDQGLDLEARLAAITMMQISRKNPLTTNLGG